MFRQLILLILGTLVLLGCGEQAIESQEHPGLKTYTKYCASCHNAGIADAPKFGDAKSWRPRIAKGRTTLLKNTIKGIPPAMPKKGLCLSCSEAQLDDAIGYMLDVLPVD